MAASGAASSSNGMEERRRHSPSGFAAEFMPTSMNVVMSLQSSTGSPESFSIIPSYT